MASTTNYPRNSAEPFAPIAEKAAETAAEVADKVKKTATNVSQAAGDMAHDLGHKADDAASSLGSGMKSLAQNIRGAAPKAGIAGSTATAVADTLERGGRYLETEKLSGIGEDLTNLVRRNPIPALLVGIGLGYLLARATRR